MWFTRRGGRCNQGLANTAQPLVHVPRMKYLAQTSKI